jgi:hypothetical protein
MSNDKGFSPAYGPPANTIAVIRKWRDHSLPEQVNGEWLSKIGLSPTLESRNLQALTFLALIDSAGYPTDAARALRTAPSNEYPSVLAEIVRSAYQPIFSVLDPGQATRTQIDDAFRHEKPEAQRSRMVAFFLGLCREAGLTLKEPPRGGRPAGTTRATGATKTQRQRKQEVTVLPPAQAIPSQVRALPRGPSLDPALMGIVEKIPELETTQDLDAWIEMFRSAFNFVKKVHPIK